MPTGAKGRSSTARIGGPDKLKGGVSNIRVIGREERTNAEQAQYRFLRHSLTVTRHSPLFVDIIWFPRNTQEINRDEDIADLPRIHSFRLFTNLNNSQRAVVRAMISTAPRNSLVIAHGILVLLQ